MTDFVEKLRAKVNSSGMVKWGDTYELAEEMGLEMHEFEAFVREHGFWTEPWPGYWTGDS